MNKICKLLSVVFGLCIHISVLLSVIFACAMSSSFYAYEYNKGDQATLIGMTDDDLMRATNALLDYIKDEREDIVEVVEVNGYEREVFNQRETLHMVDVKNLFLNASFARWVLLCVGVIGFLAVCWSQKEHFAFLQYGLQRSLIYFIVFIAFVGIWAIADFDAFWLQFHYVFFSNDLFLLDPNTSIMINMFPSTFFFDLVMLIIALFILIELVLQFIAIVLKRKKV